ncbi:MAG: hypothetical protein ACI4L2_02765 [Wujia sp.]
MKKLLKRFLVIWICTALTLFIGIGIFMKVQLGNALQPPIKEKYLTVQSVYSGESKLDDRLTAICLNAAMSDWVHEQDIEKFGKIGMIDNRLLIDRNGNIICDGVVTGVSSERGTSNLSDKKAGILIGMFSIDDTFSREQIKRIAELQTTYMDISISIDEYYADDMIFFPTKVTIWSGDDKLEEFDKLSSGYSDDTDLIKDKTLWISGVNDVCWSDADWKYEGKENLAKWAQKNIDKIFSDNTTYDESSVFKGITRYTVVNDGKYALIMRSELDGWAMCKIFAGVSAGIAFTFSFVIVLIMGTIMYVKNHRQPRFHNSAR